jgi:hypothetical protein
MGPIATSFGCAAAAVVAMSLIRGRRHPSFAIALMLLTFWAIANLTPPFVDPWMDSVGYMAAFGVWFGRANQRWAIVVWAAFGAQLVTHMVFMWSPEAVLRYQVLNCLFAVQLMATASPGVSGLIRPFVEQIWPRRAAGDFHVARTRRQSLRPIGGRGGGHRSRGRAADLGDVG